MNKNPHTKKRDSLINKLQDQISKLILDLQVDLEDYVVDYVESNLKTEGGKLIASSGNFTVIRNIDLVRKKFFKDKVNNFLKKVAIGLVKILDTNIDYYKYFDKEFSDSELRRKAESKLLNQLGIERQGSKIRFKDGGWLKDLGEFTEPYKEIKNRAIRAAGANISLSDLRRDLRKYIKGGGKLGVLEGHFNTNLTDAYAQFDALASDTFRQEIGYTIAIYQGGIIKTSRDFCIERNNKVFTIEEIEAWKEEDFEGKPDNYDPIRDRGGYNCRHFFDWIPDSLALELRPDLKSYIEKKRRK